MQALFAIPYIAVHGLSWLIGAWQVRLARFGILAVLAFAGVISLKAHWQRGLVDGAKIEAATAAAKEQAHVDYAAIVREREALALAHRRAEEAEAARQEEARRASQKPAPFDTVVIPAGDSWLRKEAAGGRR